MLYQLSYTPPRLAGCSRIDPGAQAIEMSAGVAESAHFPSFAQGRIAAPRPLL